jgi:hypothetical protein
VKCKKYELVYDTSKRLIIPDDVATTILTQVHLNLCHPGTTKTLETVKNFLYINNIKKIIENVNNNCLLCARNKLNTKNTAKSKAD